MKKIIVCIVLITISSCSTSKKTASSSVESKEVVKSKSENDGSTIEKAIVIKASDESTGVRAEYVMLGKMYPNFKMKSQGTTSKGSKNYDIMSIITADGTQKVIYFDITKFFGKF
jgi:hypothetical protein